MKRRFCEVDKLEDPLKALSTYYDLGKRAWLGVTDLINGDSDLLRVAVGFIEL